jgi:hypothetical protein
MRPRRVRVRIRNEAVKPGRIHRVRRFVERWRYYLLIGVACVVSVVLIWLVLSQMGTPLPPPPE